MGADDDVEIGAHWIVCHNTWRADFWALADREATAEGRVTAATHNVASKLDDPATTREEVAESTVRVRSSLSECA